MASKITGDTIDYDQNAPLIDVDTAIEDLAEDLNRAGRRRQFLALRQLCEVARRWGIDGWQVREEDGSVRGINAINLATRVIELEPFSEETSKEPES